MENRNDQLTSASPALSWVVTILCTAFLLAAVGLAYWSAQFHRGFYAGLNAKLPQLTVAILDLPRWSYVIVGVVLAGAIVAKEQLVQDKVTTQAINALAAAFGGVVLALFLLALEMPLASCIRNLSR